jgi:hypothetical protein
MKTCEHIIEIFDNIKSQHGQYRNIRIGHLVKCGKPANHYQIKLGVKSFICNYHIGVIKRWYKKKNIIFDETKFIKLV